MWMDAVQELAEDSRSSEERAAVVRERTEVEMRALAAKSGHVPKSNTGVLEPYMAEVMRLLDTRESLFACNRACQLRPLLQQDGAIVDGLVKSVCEDVHNRIVLASEARHRRSQPGVPGLRIVADCCHIAILAGVAARGEEQH